MEKPVFKKILTLLLAVLMSFSVISFRAVKAESSSTWEKVDDIAAAAASGKQVAITMTTSAGKVFALPTATATTGPLAREVTKDSEGNLVIDDAADAFGWTITAADGAYTITNANGNYLYVTAANNGVRVGAQPSAGHQWTVVTDTANYDYLSANPGAAARYLGVYNSQDWRCYTSTTGNSNIKQQTLEFWTLKESSEQPDEILAQLDKFTAAPENNAKVVIYYPAEQLALTTTASGQKLLGEAATIEDGKLNLTAKMAYLNVTIDSNGYYTFTTEDNKYLTSGATGNALRFEDAAGDYSLWTLQQQTDGTWYIVSAFAQYNGANQAVEYYNGFTTYGVKENNSQYKFEFYGVHGDAPAATHTVTVQQPEYGGTLSASETEVADGATVVITATPEADTKLITILVNGVEHIDQVVDNTLTLTVTEDIVVKGYFGDKNEPIRTITVLPSEHGQVYTEFDKIDNDQDIDIYVVPEEGYELTNLFISYTDAQGDHQVDLLDPAYNNLYGPREEDGVTYFFFTVDWDITVQGVFAPIVTTHTVTVEQPAEGGTLSVNKTEVAHGETVEITATPAEGYVLDKLYVNGVETAVDAEGKATVTVNSDITVTATFKKEQEEPPVICDTWTRITDLAELEDGDQVIVVNLAYNKALSTTYTGYYNIGEDVTIADDLVTNATETMVWTLGVTTAGDGTKTYTFSTAEGKKLSMAASRTSMPLDDVNDTWSIEAAPTVENAYFIKNIGRSMYIEWYASKGNWSAYGNTSDESLFAQAFFKGSKAKEGLVTDLAELEDGDQIIIVNDAYKKALSTTYTGYYNIGEDVTIADDKVTNATETMVWTVGITTNDNGDKIYTFSTAEGKKLSMAASRTSMPLDDVNDTWSIEAAPTVENAYFIKNIGRSMYIEWYASKGNWSAYGNTSDESLFAQKFYWYVKPQDQPVGETFGLTSTLADGDEVIIYNAAHGGAVGNTLSGYNVTAVALTPEEGVITTANTAVVWTVVVNDDGTYSFTQGDKVLGGVISGNYKNLVVTDATYTKWTLDGPDSSDFNYYCYLGEMTYNNGHVYLEYYNGFSLYGETTPSKENYGITFYKKGAEPETPHPQDTGDLVTSLSQLTDGATVAIYSPGHLTAISTKDNGDWYLRANSCTIENGKVVNFTSDFVWKVQVNANGTYTFLSNDDPTKSITVWPSGDYAEVTINYEAYAENGDNTWNLTPAKTANCWYISSPSIAHETKGTAYLEAYVRNECEVFSGYFTTTSSGNFREPEFALQFYLIDPNDAGPSIDDGEWDGVLNKGESYVFYNVDAQKAVGLYKEANYAMDAIETEIRDNLAYAGNGAYVFKVDTMGRYYSFEINGRYLATNPSEELLFVEKDDEGKLPDEAKWYLVPKTKDGVSGYIIYNKECRYNGTPVCMEYYSSVFSGWTYSTKNPLEIYMFQFYKLAEGIEVRDDTVQVPSVIFDCLDSRCIEQDYQVAFSLDDLAADITSITISYITGTETKTVTDYTVSADKKSYSFTIPAEEIDVESATTSFKLVVNVTNSYDIEYTGEKTVEILDIPFFEELTPAPNAQTGDDKKPVISVKVGNAGTEPTLVMTLNDEAVQAVYENGILTYQAAEDMEDGLVTVRVSCVRADGVEGEVRWNFTVGLADYQLYFGQLHSHTTYSDGSGSLETALDYIASLPESANVQFVAFTDHSNYFDTTSAANPAAAMNDASLMTPASREMWTTYRNTINNFNNRQTDLVAIAGYEMTWSGGPGHINSFNTDGLVSRNNAELNNKVGDAGMKLYYQTMNDGDSLNQFNHPGTTFGTFTDFAYWDEATDAHIFLVEVGNGEGQIGAGGYYPSYEEYIKALDKGWHLAPTNNQDNHKGRWGNANDARDVVLTNSLTVEGIYDAIRNLRVYATEDRNLQIGYTVNGETMGTVFNDNNPVGEKMNVTVTLFDPDGSDAITKVELVSDGGVTSYTWNNAEEIASGILTAEIDPEYSYYFVRVTQRDGDLAVTAPVWTRSAYRVGFESVATGDGAEKVYVNEPFTLTATLYNQEDIAATVKSVTFTSNGNEVLGTVSGDKALAANGTVSVSLENVVLTKAKLTTITATAVVEIDGKTYTYTKDLTLEVADRENENKITPIAEVRAASDPEDTGYIFNIEGVVSSNASGYDKDTAFFDCIYVQDATGGICCFPVSGEYKVGDKVRIKGHTDFYQGEPELQVDNIEIIEELATPYELEATEITADQLNDRSAEGKLVTIKGTVDSFELANELVQTIMVRDSEGKLARVFIDGYITTEHEVENLAVGAPVEATGLASYDDTFNAPEGPFPRIRVRDRADVICAKLAYTITFVNYDGTVLQSGEVATGTMPVYEGATPEKPATATHIYVFKGWDPELAEVSADATYTAVYEEVAKDVPYITSLENEGTKGGIKVTFKDDSGVGVYEIQVSEDGETWTSLGEDISVCIYSDTTATWMGRTYYYRVRTLMDGLWGEFSEVASLVRNPFVDVDKESEDFEYVAWAYNNGIVNGTDETHYKLEGLCTRAQFCIMLYKMAGKPSVKGMTCPFEDIDDVTSTNRKAIIWCYNQGIINGTSATTFAPKGKITKTQLCIMVYKYAGKPSVSGLSCPYTDIADLTSNNRKAIIWAYSNGMMDGVDETTFGPNLRGTRAQLTKLLYFLNQYMQNQGN